ncbi:hypothetical protein [Mycobacterium sp.]|uniref:hypothetical protein n=1 Tax=Mycobacterium sp. TaxID=1785 RepID=UPI003C710D20
MGEVFKGSEAITQGELTGWALRRWYRPIFRDVYVPKQHVLTVQDRTVGAWLWSKRNAVITGVAASALHGAEWVQADIPIELRMDCSRPPRGIIARDNNLLSDEVMYVSELRVTTPARTAFDLGRYLRRGQALARLDALMRATPFSVEDVQLLIKRYKGARGIRQLRERLPLVDGGAASPRETWLRLLYIDAGLPKPTTQIPVVENGRLVRMLDMGWENFMVAAEYDGEQHQTSRLQYLKDMDVLPRLARLGWIVDRVVKEHREADIIRRAYNAMTSRGWKP